MLEVTGLHKSYGDLVAVEEVSFVARPGEMVGLLEPSVRNPGGPGGKPGDRPEFPAKCAGNYVSVPNGAPAERRASSTPSAVVRQENCAARSGPAAASL